MQGTIEPPTQQNPNPKKFFSQDQQLNGRLRDIAVSPDGKKIYLINNGGGTLNTSKITVYTYDENASLGEEASSELKIYPNPASESIQVLLPDSTPARIEIYDPKGKKLLDELNETELITVDLSNFSAGVYLLRCQSENTNYVRRFVKK